MTAAVKRKNTRYNAPGASYGNVAYDLDYAGSVARPLERGGSEVLRPRPKARPRERVIARPVVRVREAGQVSLFAVVGFLAVGMFAALLLMSCVQLAVAADNVASLSSELNTLQAEQKKLLASYELAYDLSSIEAQVTAEGRMVKPEAGQIYTIDLSEPDSVVHYDQTVVGAADMGVLGEAEHMVGGILEYFR